MGLSVGIVGLPNVGKSTTFNALAKVQKAEAANYPFCTIEPNKANVSVPDTRIEKLAKIVNPQKLVYSMVSFVDIAGLVEGASKGEGLGNKFLSNIRETEVILHMVRCFEDENIIHTQDNIDPIRDIEIIENELVFADLETIERKLEKLKKHAKFDKDSAKKLEFLEKLNNFILEGNRIFDFPEYESEMFQDLNTELRFLSAKEIVYGANVDEDSLDEDNEYVIKLKGYAKKLNRDVIKICAKLEEELIELNDEEKNEFLSELGLEETGLEKIIKTGFDKVGLMNYFTAGPLEVKSWTIKKNTLAPKAASVIHKDFEKGFIRAEVISYGDYIKYNGEQGSKNAGKLRLEGKDYVVQDGDVMHFRFNV